MIVRAAAIIKDRRLELGKLLSLESGKPYMAEAVWEFDSVAYILEASCEVAKHYYGTTMPVGIEPGYDHDIQFTLHEPIGVIACVIRFNFPPALWRSRWEPLLQRAMRLSRRHRRLTHCLFLNATKF